jgi:hypothetical protein
MSKEQEKRVRSIAAAQIEAASGVTKLAPKEIAAFVVNGNGVRPDQERAILKEFGGEDSIRELRHSLTAEYA